MSRGRAEDADGEEPQEPWLGGRFRLGLRLGGGGMGEVFEAREKGGRVVAVKLLRERLAGDEDDRRRMLREAAHARRFDHENIVRVEETGDDERLGPFLVMELLRGRTLAEQLAAGRPLSPAVAASVARQVALALAEVHREGQVHRDVKPSNIFLAEQGGRVVAKLCDFGIAKRAQAHEGDSTSLTTTGSVLGSPRYMSPEQAADRTLDGRSDLFSLAVTLWEALGEQKPWESHRSPQQIVAALLTEELPPLDQTAPWVPLRLRQLVAQGLRKAPEERLQSASALAAALAPWALPRPLEAADFKPLDRAAIELAAREVAASDPGGQTGTDIVVIRKNLQRRRLPALGLAGCLILLAGGAFLRRNAPGAADPAGPREALAAAAGKPAKPGSGGADEPAPAAGSATGERSAAASPEDAARGEGDSPAARGDHAANGHGGAAVGNGDAAAGAAGGNAGSGNAGGRNAAGGSAGRGNAASGTAGRGNAGQAGPTKGAEARGTEGSAGKTASHGEGSAATSGAASAAAEGTGRAAAGGPATGEAKPPPAASDKPPEPKINPRF